MTVRLPCAEHRCPEYALPGKSRCAVHQREWDQGRWDRGGTGQRGSQHQPPRALRSRIWHEQGRRCGECRKQVVKFFLHHIDGNARNNARRNLVCLCKTCHDAADRALRLKKRGL